MTPKILQPKEVLNKAYRRVKPIRSSIENFKANLIRLLEGINNGESEEFHKNLVIEFLKNTWNQPHNFINTKGRNDLVIHNGKDAGSTVWVLIEAKKPANKHEMLQLHQINSKTLQELLLYYLRERITCKNLELKFIAATIFMNGLFSMPPFLKNILPIISSWLSCLLTLKKNV